MKVATAANEVISYSDEGAVEQQFGAIINAKTFFAMSSGLYKNKIGTVVREISSNAYDSHISAGKRDVPFEIHLPNSFESYFHVKDFGIGLDQDDIEGKIDPADGKRKLGLLTTLFLSSKDQSDENLGGWGLGFKSFFSYTDSATITTVKNGVKYHYSAYINDKGIPACLLLAKEDTDECNGVTVSINVQKDHYRRFRDEVEEQLAFFPVKPTLINGSIDWNTNLNAGNPDLLVDTENVRIKDSRKSKYGEDGDDHFVVLGVVGYKLEMDNLRESPRFTKQVQNFMNSIAGRCALLMKISDVQVTVSREGLQYTKKTIDAILDKIEIARQETFERITKEVDLSGTPWEKAVKANSYGELTKLFQNTGLKIDQAEEYGGFYVFKPKMAQVGHVNAQGTMLIDWSLADYKLTDAGTFRRDSLDIDKVQPGRNKVFFVQDTTKKPVARVKEYFLDNRDKKIHVFDRTSKEWTDAEIAELSRVLGGVAIVRASTLPEPKLRNRNGDEAPAGPRGGYKIPTGYQLNRSKFTKMSGKRLDEPFAEKVFDDIEDITPAIYIGGERGVADDSKIYTVGKRTYTMFGMLDKLADFYDAVKLPFPEIFLFNKRSLATVQEVGGWTTVDDFINNGIAEFMKRVQTVQAIRVADKIKDAIEHFMQEGYLDKMILPENFKKLDKNAGSYPIRLYKKITTRFKTDDFRRTLMNMFDLTDFTSEDEERLTPFTDKIGVAKKLLPFVEHMPRYWRYDYQEDNAKAMVTHTIGYINTMGKVELLPQPVVVAPEQDEDEPVEVDMAA